MELVMTANINCFKNNEQLNNNALPIVFNNTSPSAKDLIIWSTVNKQFYICAHDINLWKNFAQQHSIAHCQSGREIKQIIVEIARGKFCDKNNIDGNLFQIKIPQQFMTCPPKASSQEFPIKINERTYSMTSDFYLKYSYPNSSVIDQQIALDGCLNDTSIVNFNSDFIVYSINHNGSYWGTGRQGREQWITDRCGYTDVKIIPLDPLRLNFTLYPDFLRDCSDFGGKNCNIIYSKFNAAITNIQSTSGNICITDKSEITFTNYSIIPLRKVLKKFTEIERNEIADQIFILREFLSPKVKIPDEFFCVITGQILLNPVRDHCGGENGGHVFEEMVILKALSEGLPLPKKPELGVITAGLCPFTNSAMPDLQRTSLNYVSDTVVVSVELDDGSVRRIPTQKYTTRYDVDSSRALIPDEELQSKILEWLKSEVFGEQFNCLSDEKKNSVYGHLFQIQKYSHSYWGIAEDAFHNRNGQSSTTAEKIEALRNSLIETHASRTFLGFAYTSKGIESQSLGIIPYTLDEKVIRLTRDFSEFYYLPPSIKNQIYSHLFQIQKPSHAYWGISEDAFHDQNGQSSTVAEKIEAMRCCLREIQINVIDEIASFNLDFNAFCLNS
jgi:hypothetical protein